MHHTDRDAYLAIAGIYAMPAEAGRLRHRLPPKEALRSALEEERTRAVLRLKHAASKLQAFSDCGK
jgi:hypothetical protein